MKKRKKAKKVKKTKVRISQKRRKRKAIKIRKTKKPKIKRKILKIVKKHAKKAKKIKAKKKAKLKLKVKNIVAKKIASEPQDKKSAPVLPKEEEVHNTKIRIIGIGGGAGSIISEIAPDVKKVDFVAVNTDSKSLREVSKKVKKFQFGQSVTKGLGTGMNDVLGEIAAQNDKEKIKKILEGQDLCVIVSCLGGGTSSGATPVIAKIARSLGNLTYGIFTLPFDFEGEKKMEMAIKSLEKVKSSLNAYSVIPNERIFQVIDKNTPLRNALSVINKKLADNLEGLIEMIYLAGLINIDFADLRTILKGRGRLTYLNAAELEALDKEEVVKKAISNPLYPYSLKGARGVLYNIHGGKNLQLLEAASISRAISDAVNRNAKIIFGINQNIRNNDKIKITILATGCGAKLFLGAAKQRNKGVKKNPKIRKKMKLSKSKSKKPVRNKIKKSARALKKNKIIKKKIAKKPPLSQEGAHRQPLFQPAARFPFEAERTEIKVRRTGLELKKEMEQEENHLLEQEKFLETPAILRKNTEDKNSPG